MRAKWSLAALTFALCLCPLCAAFALDAPKPPAPDPAAAQKIDPQVLAKVVPGISKTQVKSLLGDPWRTVQYNDLDAIENEFWEYRGRDADGPYRVHIEFDTHDTVVIVGKVPDKQVRGEGTRAKS
jgi:hypothetical protein